MNNSRKYFILISILIGIIIILALILNSINKKERNKQDEPVYDEHVSYAELGEPTKTEEEIDTSIEVVDVLRLYTCMNKFLSAINLDNPSYYAYDDEGNIIKLATDEEINKNIIDVLSKNYISKNSINESNASEFVYKLNQGTMFALIEMNKISSEEQTRTYKVYGVLTTGSNEPVGEVYFIINIDPVRKTFSIEPLVSKEAYDSVQYTEVGKIEKNNRNTFTDSKNKDEDILKLYLASYKRIALAYPEIAYERLIEEEYKKARFGTVDKYKEYIEENRQKIARIAIEQYDIQERDGYTQYIIVDKDERYYFFNCTTPSNYKILLDYYTIDVEPFASAYIAAELDEKVMYNCDKVMDAINGGNYTFVYSKLSEGFKANNFRTEEDLKLKLKNSLFEKNEIIGLSTNLEGEVYVCNVKVANMENESETKDITIIMQLGEGTNFVMSFNVD